MKTFFLTIIVLFSTIIQAQEEERIQLTDQEFQQLINKDDIIAKQVYKKISSAVSTTQVCESTESPLGTISMCKNIAYNVFYIKRNNTVVYSEPLYQESKPKTNKVVDLSI